MSLADTKNTLESIANDAKALKDRLTTLAAADSTPDQDLGQLNGLFDQLDEQIAAAESDEAAEARGRRLQQLDEAIGHLEGALSAPGISPDTREVIKEERDSMLADKARLTGAAGTNFRGVLGEAESEQLKQALIAARNEVAQKKNVAAAIGAALGAVDIALTIAGKLKLVL